MSSNLIPDGFLESLNERRDNPDIDVDVTSVPPARYLSKATQKLLAARDMAFDKFSDAEADWYELLAPDWARSFAAKDEAAAQVAAAEGKDVMSLPSALEEARTKRPKAIGALRALAAEARRTDSALVAAVRREMDSIQEAIEKDVQAAAQAYVDAQRAADQARESYGGKLLGRAWVTNWSLLGLRTDYADRPEATPVNASGHPVQDVYGRPVQLGAAEVKAIDDSYGNVIGKPKVTIRSLVNGSVLTIDPSHAASQVANGQAEYAEDQA